MQRSAEESFEYEILSGKERFLLIGAKGWIGSMVYNILLNRNCIVYAYTNRMEERETMLNVVTFYNPTHVICIAGVPSNDSNVDWCETHKVETIRNNVLGVLNVADICEQNRIHCTIYGTGCIYTYTPTKQIFDENDTPNFVGSFYSYTKGYVDKLLQNYKYVLLLRIRMPIGNDYHPRNFLTKIEKYTKIHSVPNSMTVLSQLVPVSLVMTVRNIKGVFNFTNPGVISHKECLELYRKYIDPNHECEYVEDLGDLVIAERSNNELDTKKLLDAVPDIYIPNILEAVGETMITRANLVRSNT